MPSQSTSTVESINIPSIEESRRSIEESRSSIAESERSIEESRLSIAESERRIEAAPEEEQYTIFSKLSKELRKSEEAFGQIWPEENPIFLGRIIRGTTARLCETELQLPQGSIKLDLGQTPNLEELNLEVFNRIFGIILSNLGQLLKLKPEIVGQIGGVGIFYEPARYPEFLSRAAEVKVSGVSSTNSTTTSTPSNPSNSSASLPSKSGLTPVPGETPIPINEVDGLRFVLQSLPGEIKVKLGGEESYLPLVHRYLILASLGNILQQLTPEDLATIAPLNLKSPTAVDEEINKQIQDLEKLLNMTPTDMTEPLDERETEKRFATDEEKKNPICGPDVTEEIKATLPEMKERFANQPPSIKQKLCESLTNIPEALKSWDIIELHRWGQIPDLQIKKNYNLPDGRQCATPDPDSKTDCSISVEVNKQCYYAGSVNYVVFGAMFKLCNEAQVRFFGVLPYAEWTRDAYIDLYKGPFNLNLKPSPNWLPSRGWAKAGYDGWPEPPAQQPEADRPQCQTICGQPYGGGQMSVHWKVRMNIRNKPLDIREQLNRLRRWWHIRR